MGSVVAIDDVTGRLGVGVRSQSDEDVAIQSREAPRVMLS